MKLNILKKIIIIISIFYSWLVHADVNLKKGEFYLINTDIRLGNLEYIRRFGSQDYNNNNHGPGWSSNFDIIISKLDQDRISITSHHCGGLDIETIFLKRSDQNF